MGIDRTDEEDPAQEEELDGDLCSQTVRELVEHPFFEIFIFVTICINAVTMAVFGPEPEPGSLGSELSFWTVVLFTPIYTFEMLLKMWGLGLWRNERSYLVDNWCRFDLLVVIAAWVDVVFMVIPNGDEDRTNLLVARLVRSCRMFRVVRGAAKLEAARIMVLVLLKTLVNSKWVLIVVTGFGACVCTLGLNWFGSEMRYKCARVDNLIDASGASFSLGEDDRNQLQLGKAWNEVTSEPYRLRIPPTFCRHSTRPGPDDWGQQCGEDGMMCVHINEPPFADWLGFENIGTASLTVLLIILQQQFDSVVLSTMQATVGPSAVFFAAIIVFGSFFLLEYVTAILCITYAEVRSTGDALGTTRDNADQALLQIELAEGQHHDESHESVDDTSSASGLKAHDRGEITLRAETTWGADIMDDKRISKTKVAGEGGVRKGLRKVAENVTAADIRVSTPGGPVGFLDRLWVVRKRYRDWSQREPKTPDVISFPFVNYQLEVNVEAFARIKKRVAETNSQDSKIVRGLRIGRDMTCYVVGSAVMYPSPSSEMHGALGWHGSSNSGVLSHWEVFITALSVLEVANDVALSYDRIQSRKDGLEPPTEQSYGGLSLVIWAIFVADIAIKIIAYKGPWPYLHSTLNQLDLTVTMLQFIGQMTWKHPNLACLRVSRWITVLALARKFSNFHELLEKAFGSLFEAITAISVIVFFLCLIAVFGQQIFAGADWAEYPRPYFSTFYLSLVSVIEFSSNGGLLDMLRQGMTIGIYTGFFLIPCTIFVNLLLLRLLIPFMLQKCDESEMFKIRYQIFFGSVVGKDALIWKNTKQHARLLAFWKMFHHDDHDSALFIRLAKEKAKGPADSKGVGLESQSVQPYEDGTPDKLLRSVSQHVPVPRMTPTKVKPERSIRLAAVAWHSYGHLQDGHMSNGSELRKFKKAFVHVVHSKYYEPVLGLVVLVACYVFSARPEWNSPEWADKTLKLVLLLAFHAEVVLKSWVSYGHSVSKKFFFKDPLHIPEIVALFGMWIALFPVIPYAYALTNLRFFHLLRVLRALAVIPDIELAYDRLDALRVDISHCLTIVAFLVIAFSVLAMQLFGGLFSACNDAEVADRAECSGTTLLEAENQDGELFILRPRSWEASEENFDSLPAALGTSFSLFLNTGWSVVINGALSVSPGGMQPTQYGVGLLGMAFVAYQTLAMILRQLLIAMVINSLRIASGTSLQTDDQKAWIATQRMCETKCTAYMLSRGSMGGKGLQGAIALKRHWLFRTVIEITIVINIITMLCVNYSASPMQVDIMQYINSVCLLVYYVEMMTTLVAEAHIYFTNSWNIFDAIINIVSTLDLYYWYFDVNGGEASFEIMSLRSARVLRLVKLAGRSPQISLLLRFSIKAIKSCIGCYLLWLFLMILFAIPATEMFSNIRQSLRIDSSTYSNFDLLHHSMLYLFRIATQNSFIQEAQELGVREPYCTAANQTMVQSGQGSVGDCGPDSVSIWVFFTLFTGLSRLVIVPFIAGCVVFTFFETMDELRSVLSSDDVAKFEQCWDTLDPDRTGYIGVWKLPSLMERMRSSSSPLWFDPQKHPDKQVLFDSMLGDEMETTRADLKEKMEKSRIFRMKYDKDPGLQPGQLRYDCLLKTLTALKRFPSALATPPTELYAKMENICAETFNYTQDQKIGAILRKTVLAKRQAAIDLLRDGNAVHLVNEEGISSSMKGITRGAAQIQAARKEGLQPLTRKNLAEFHEEEESWEDPKDYAEMHPRFSVFWLFFSALRPVCGEEGLPVSMKAVMTINPPTKVEDWIHLNEVHGEDADKDDEDEVRSEDKRSATSRRSGTRTAQTKGAARSALSVRSELDEAKWRVNKGNWDDIGSSASEEDEISMHNMPTARPGGISQRSAVPPHAPHATAHIFFAATWQEVVGEESDVEAYLDQLAGDVAFSLHIPDDLVEVVSFDKTNVCAEAHLRPPATFRMPTTARGKSSDPLKHAEELRRQASDRRSDLRTLQPYVNKVEVTPPVNVNPLMQVGAGIGGVDDIFTEDHSKPPNFFSLVGTMSRSLFEQ